MLADELSPATTRPAQLAPWGSAGLAIPAPAPPTAECLPERVEPRGPSGRSPSLVTSNTPSALGHLADDRLSMPWPPAHHVAVRPVRHHRRDQGALGDRGVYGSIPTWSQTARTLADGDRGELHAEAASDAAATRSARRAPRPRSRRASRSRPRCCRPNPRATVASGTTVICSNSASAARTTSAPTPSASRSGNVAANNAVASIAAPFVTITRSPGRAIVGHDSSSGPGAMQIAPPTIGHVQPSYRAVWPVTTAIPILARSMERVP